MITCQICQKQFKILNSHIIFKHNMSPQKYKEKFNSPLLSEDSRNNIREAALKRDNTNYKGIIRSNEWKEKISANAKKRMADPTKNPMYGKTHSKETREKISKLLKGKSTKLKGISKPFPRNGIEKSIERRRLMNTGVIPMTTKLKEYRERISAEKAERDKIKAKNKEIKQLEKLKKRRDASLQRMFDTHGSKYEYPFFEKEYVKQYSKITIVCPKHGNFYQQVHAHIVGQTCPRCVGFGASQESKVVLKPLIDYLDDNNIEYLFDDKEFYIQLDLEEYKIQGVGRRFSYDLVVPSHNLCIEYNGLRWHPDWEILTESEWKEWRQGFSKDGKTAKECIEYDHFKAAYLYYKTGYHTWFINPSNGETVISLIFKHYFDIDVF